MKTLFQFLPLLLVLLFSVNSNAENIDECKNDLYFANGIMMKYSPRKALDMWKKSADDLLLLKPEITSKIAKITISYNKSQGFLDDLLESFEQVMSNEWGWKDFSLYFAIYLKEKGIQEDFIPHMEDLVKQVTQYKKSIKLGHNVIVVAHSQGNYYTNEAYDMLDDWMKPYFHMMGVATPADHVAGDGPYVKFHNDFIKIVVTGLPSNRVDPNPKHNQTFSIAAHDFYASYLASDNTRTDIINFIESRVKNHEKAPSQWETDQEFERNTCNYRITVKHRYDPSIEMGEKVYPFNGSKKLYKAKNKAGAYEYVKASCGGENILETWDGKKDNECLMIDNAEKEKIEIKQQHRVLMCQASFFHYAFIYKGKNNVHDSMHCSVLRSSSPITLPEGGNAFKGVTFDDYYPDSDYLNEHGIVRYPNEFDKAFETFHQVAFKLGMERMEEYKKTFYKTIKSFPNTGKIILEKQIATGPVGFLNNPKNIPCAPFALKERDYEGCGYRIEVEILP